MEVVLVLTNQLASMFVYMLIGYIMSRMGLINQQGSTALSNLLLYVILPCVILNAFTTQESSAGKGGALVASLGLALIVLGFAMAVSALLFRKRPTANFGAAFSNAGFMGIPLITAVLGQESVFYTVGMVALLNIFQWSYGQAILSGSLRQLRLRDALVNPLMVAFAVGLAMYALSMSLPEPLNGVMSTLAGCNGPVAMVILGVLLGAVPLREIFCSKTVWQVTGVRLVLIPVLTVALLACFPATSAQMRTAILIASSAPVGSNLAVYVQKLGRDSEEAVKMVCLSTLVCAVTMPAVLALGYLVWGLA